jgi:hypothetical protein
MRLKERADKAFKDAQEACEKAGLDYDTLEPLDGSEIVIIESPDADLRNL